MYQLLSRNLRASKSVVVFIGVLLIMPAMIFGQLPSNDSCDLAEPVEIGMTVRSTTVGAAVDTLPTCGLTGVSPGVWFSVIGDGSQLSVDVCPSTLRMVVSILCGDSDDLGCMSLGCIDSETWPYGQSCRSDLLTWCSEPGVEYLIHVQGPSQFEMGEFELTVSSTLASCPRGSSCLDAPDPPANDGCDNPVVIVGDGDYPFSLKGASVVGELQGCAQSNTFKKDVWLSGRQLCMTGRNLVSVAGRTFLLAWRRINAIAGLQTK